MAKAVALSQGNTADLETLVRSKGYTVRQAIVLKSPSGRVNEAGFPETTGCYGGDSHRMVFQGHTESGEMSSLLP